MSEDIARAVGAGGVGTFTVKGKPCRTRPLRIKELTEVQRECLERYKRQHLQTFRRNIDLLYTDNAQAEAAMRKEFDLVVGWELRDLPARYVYNQHELIITDKLAAWLQDAMPHAVTDAGGQPLAAEAAQRLRQRLAVTALDAQMLSESQYEELTGQRPRKTRVGYVHWWITATTEGMVTMIWKIVEQNGLTWDDVFSEMGHNMDMLIAISREIEQLTAPAVGNG